MGRKESDTTERLNWTDLNATKPRKEWNSAICNNVDAPSENDAEWNKSGREIYTLYAITLCEI